MSGVHTPKSDPVIVDDQYRVIPEGQGLGLHVVVQVAHDDAVGEFAAPLIAVVDQAIENDLANSLKVVALPGESMHVRIVKPGEEADQGIGYLDDGTMIVVEGARSKKGKPMSKRLAEELFDAFNKQGSAYTKRENTHKMAEANEAFAHFAW